MSKLLALSLLALYRARVAEFNTWYISLNIVKLHSLSSAPIQKTSEGSIWITFLHASPVSELGSQHVPTLFKNVLLLQMVHLGAYHQHEYFLQYERL